MAVEAAEEASPRGVAFVFVGLAASAARQQYHVATERCGALRRSSACELVNHRATC